MTYFAFLHEHNNVMYSRDNFLEHEFRVNPSVFPSVIERDMGMGIGNKHEVKLCRRFLRHGDVPVTKVVLAFAADSDFDTGSVRLRKFLFDLENVFKILRNVPVRRTGYGRVPHMIRKSDEAVIQLSRLPDVIRRNAFRFAAAGQSCMDVNIFSENHGSVLPVRITVCQDPTAGGREHICPGYPWP